MYKTHTCGELRRTHTGHEVTLAGWVHRRRDHGGVTFIDLRDRFGLVQVVANPEISPKAHEKIVDVRTEWVIQIKGIVKLRPRLSTNKGQRQAADFRAVCPGAVFPHRSSILN